MDIKTIQTSLNSFAPPAPKLAVDGVPGRNTMRAVDAVLGEHAKGSDDWSDARKLVAIEQWIYKENDIEVGGIDGLVGEQTRYARRVFDDKLRGKNDEATFRDKDEPVVDTKPTNADAWPKQADCTSFFGSVGANQTSLVMPFPLRIAWAPDQQVQKVSCHSKVRFPLERIWKRTLDRYGYDRLKALRLDMFGGCLNVRRMRGGSSWSMHSWGIAWDIDPDRNQLRWGRDKASLDAPDYEPFWRFVEEEGAVSLGRARNFDWMHFQFARL